MGSIGQLVSLAAHLPVKDGPVRVVHTLSGILQHVAIPCEGILYLVANVPMVGVRTDALKLYQCLFQSSGIQQPVYVFDSFVHILFRLSDKDRKSFRSI